jgi:L-seryl-tRNA(Ser) seleniumtransferase
MDRLLKTSAAQPLLERYGRPALYQALQAALKTARQQVQQGGALPLETDLFEQAALALASNNTLRSVINATGIILHTNLGRAVLSEEAIAAMGSVAAHYSTLEYDLTAGQRGKRDQHPERLLKEITGAEAALVVNNNAAATMLMLSALAQNKGVLISRGQLVEIGGGFRMPDVMLQSGARLVEVGTTNRTRLADFANAITPESAMILRVHSSNFKQIGFVEQPSLAELAVLAADHGLISADDLGSGALLDTAAFGLDHEPTVQESIKAGFDLVCFSGDKLLGGPQAGIIVGKAPLVARLRQYPLARAMRIDKLCLAALVATLEHYHRGQALEKIPLWRMISITPEAIQQRAAGWLLALGLATGAVVPAQSMVGGGSLPGDSIPSFALALPSNDPDAFIARLRARPQPVIARIANNQVLFDPRTVLPSQDEALLAAIAAAR